MNDLAESARKFWQRWSERKRASENPAPDGKPLSVESKETDTNAVTQSGADLPAFDPASLPPIEAITATSDIRAFLAPGVPEDLARAALRRAWITDPKIRDFIGIAENQWDFTNPNSVPGFGLLELTPELRRMAANLIGGPPAQAAQQHADAGRGKHISETDANADQSDRQEPIPGMDRPADRG
jgi:hypothetical protein